MTCAYCKEPIQDLAYTYKYFPDTKTTLPVHSKHLTISHTKQDTARFNPHKRKETTDAPPQQPTDTAISEYDQGPA